MNKASGPDDGRRIRLAGPDDRAAVEALTEEAYRPYTEIFDAPPIPATEDYRPHIAANGVWLLESKASRLYRDGPPHQSASPRLNVGRHGESA